MFGDPFYTLGRLYGHDLLKMEQSASLHLDAFHRKVGISDSKFSGSFSRLRPAPTRFPAQYFPDSGPTRGLPRLQTGCSSGSTALTAKRFAGPEGLSSHSRGLLSV